MLLTEQQLVLCYWAMAETSWLLAAFSPFPPGHPARLHFPGSLAVRVPLWLSSGQWDMGRTDVHHCQAWYIKQHCNLRFLLPLLGVRTRRYWGEPPGEKNLDSGSWLGGALSLLPTVSRAGHGWKPDRLSQRASCTLFYSSSQALD